MFLTRNRVVTVSITAIISALPSQRGSLHAVFAVATAILMPFALQTPEDQSNFQGSSKTDKGANFRSNETLSTQNIEWTPKPYQPKPRAR